MTTQLVCLVICWIMATVNGFFGEINNAYPFMAAMVIICAMSKENP